MSCVKSIVCVVEDDLDVCDSLDAVVTALGHICHTFDSAEALLRYWECGQCDCLIVDFDLPEMNGLELLERLQQQTHNVTSILYTGRVDSRIRQAAQRLGGIPVVEKGPDNNAICSHLKALLNNTISRP
ncbi:MAG: response regulator [Planctomycetaceae bacterium]|nr:response regulator [Planctomycetaceae bacterium]